MVFNLRNVNLKAMENIQSLSLPNLIQHLGGWSPFPAGAIFALTIRCNMKCVMCAQVEARQQGNTSELTLDEIEDVVDDLVASFRFKPFIHLTGGEPLLRRDLLLLLAYIKEHGFNCSLTTNGLLLEHYAEELARLELNRIHVSIDGPPQIHDQMRGVTGAHDRAIAGIRALAMARQARQANKPAITINTVITSKNLSHLDEMIPIAQAAGADSLSYQHLIFSDCSAQGQAVPDVQQLLATIPRLRQQARAIGLPITFYPRMGERQLRLYYQGHEDELNRKCVFPWYVVRVDMLGNITPCRGFIVDNIKAKSGSFGQVWNSQRFRNYRNRLAQLGVFPDCGRCCHRQY